jgi:hypothetical protein
MNIKKIIGWVLAFIGVALFTVFLVEQSSLKDVIMAYGFTILTVSFVFLVGWLLIDD